MNYRIHTDAIKENLLPPELTPEQISYTYANEADMLNMALFGKTARQWRDANPDKKGNMRDDARACLKIAFRQICVPVCGRFGPNEGRIAGYVT